MSSSYLTILLLLLPALSFTTAKPSAGPTVLTPSNTTILGQPARLNPHVHEYLGIPYALPPTGPLRFHAPSPIPPPRGPTTINATTFGLSCPAVPPEPNSVKTALSLPYNSTEIAPQGEDCLNLNIWTKPGGRRGKVPVLVWIYGGGFKFGTTNELRTDGAAWVAGNEVVVVTVNYRTNVFGFPNAAGLPDQNLGILDQRLALQWVKDNIASFGGDPDRITLFGHSAGATAVDIHAYAWPEDPIVNGFILQSGTVGLLPHIGGGDPATFYGWGNLTEAVGCTGTGTSGGSGSTEQEVLSCMQGLPWEEVVEGMKGLQTCNSTVPGFGPRVDGRVVFSQGEYKRKGSAGEFAKLPMLIGSTNAEIGPGTSLATGGLSCPANPPLGLSPELYAEISTAVAFTCPAKQASNARYTNSVPTWRYRYYGSVNLTSPSTGAPITLGAGHGSELPILFGSAAYIGTLDPRTQAIVTYLQAMWTQFAAAPKTGLLAAPFQLPKYNSLGKTLIRLAYDGDRAAEPSRTWPVEYDALCAIVEALPTGVARRGVGRMGEVRVREVQAVFRLDAGTVEQLEAVGQAVMKGVSGALTGV